MPWERGRRRVETVLTTLARLAILAMLGLSLFIPLWVRFTAEAGPGGKQKTLEFSGTAPVGAYTYPASFANGRAMGAGMTRLGVEVTRDQLTNPATVAELVIEVSYDGGWTWPPGCVSAPTCRCHEATQTIPDQTQVCAIRVHGGETTEVSSFECTWTRVTDTQTRLRGRLHVCGASATGAIYTTWR